MTACILPSLEICNKWIQENIYETKCQHIGFDSESRPSSGVLAIIQIATPLSVMIYRVYEKPIIDWPIQLVKILEDATIFKYCVDIREDIKLLINIGLKPTNFIDLQISAQKHLNITHRLGFKVLVKTLLNIDLNKSKSIQCSNWSKLPLTQKQIEYACDDAIGCLALAETMKLYESQQSILDKPAWKAKYLTKFIDPRKNDSRLGQLESVLIEILICFKKFQLHKNTEGYILIKDIMNIPELYFTLDDIEQIITNSQKKKLELQLVEGNHYIRIKSKATPVAQI